MLNLHETRIATTQFRFFIHLYVLLDTLFCFRYIIEFFSCLRAIVHQFQSTLFLVRFCSMYAYKYKYIFFMLRYIMLRNYLIDFRTKHYSFYGSACVIFHPIFTMYYNEENIFFFLFQDVVIYFESLLVTTLGFFHFAKNFSFLKSLRFLYFLHWNWIIVINIKYKQKYSTT